MTTPVARVGARPRSRLLPRLIVLLLLTLAAGVGLAGPAAAHNVLISSDPTDGSTLQTAPTTVRLTFDQPVQNFEPVVTVLGPDGQHYESGPPEIDSTVVTAGVGTLPVAGAYAIAYRIVSADGHPVQGEITFELATGAVATGGTGAAGTGAAGTGAAGTGAAGSAPSVAPTTSVAIAPAASSSGLSGWVWAAIIVAAVLIVAAVVVIVRRPRQPV